MTSWDNETYFKKWETKLINKYKLDSPKKAVKKEEDYDQHMDDYEWKPNINVITFKKKGKVKRLGKGGKLLGKSSCPVCNKVVKKLSIHMQSAHPDVKPEDEPDTASKRGRKRASVFYQCQSCDFEVKTEKKLREHMFTEHDIPFSCEECNLIFDSLEQYVKHLRTHTLSCEICNKNVMDMKRHMENMHTEEGDKMEPCHVCGKILRIRQMKGHISKVHADKLYPCSICPHTSKTNHDLQKHIKRKHTEANPVNCPWCGRLTKDLDRHLRNNKCNVPESERTINVVYACEHCGKEVKSQASLLNHFRIVHEKIKNHECDQCNYKASTNYNLRIHQKRIHEKRPLKEMCPHCDKSFVNLDYHIETYHGELVGYEMKNVEIMATS